MKKKVLLFVMFILMSISLFSKNIFIVYDDSKSMRKDNRYVFANYSLQHLISLMEEGDSVVISHISDYLNDYVNLDTVDLKNIPKELERIKGKNNLKSNETLYTGVENLVNHINKNYDKTTENWILVITDGEFEDKINEDFIKSLPQIIENTGIKPVFLVIGSGEKNTNLIENQEGIYLWKKAFGHGQFPKVFKAINEKEILEEMKKIGEMFNSSYQRENELFSIEENNVIFNSVFPLKKVTLSTQKDKQNEINSLEKVWLNGKEIIEFQVYKPSINKSGINLAGEIIQIQLPAGLNEYNIRMSFEKKVNDEMTLFPMVRADFEVQLYDENHKLVNSKLIEEDEGKEFRVAAHLDINGENKDFLLDDVVVEVFYGDDIVPLTYIPQTQIFEGRIKVNKGKSSIDSSAKYDGYFYYQSDIFIIDGLEVVAPPKQTLSILKTDDNFKISTDDIEYENIFIVPLLDGEEATDYEIMDIDIEVDTELEGRTSNEKVVFSDGKSRNGWIYRVKKHHDMLNFHKNPSGIKKLDVKVSGENLRSPIETQIIVDFEKITFWSKYGRLIKLILTTLTIVICLIGHLIKRRFTKNGRVIIVQRDGRKEMTPKKNDLKANLAQILIPYLNHKTQVGRLEFLADGRRVKVKTAVLKSEYFEDNDVKEITFNDGELTDSSLKKMDYKRFSDGNVLKIVYKNKREIEYKYKA